MTKVKIVDGFCPSCRVWYRWRRREAGQALPHSKCPTCATTPLQSLGRSLIDRAKTVRLCGDAPREVSFSEVAA